MDYSSRGSSAHGFLQARILEWVAVSFSRGSPDPGIKSGSPTLEADCLPSEPPEGPERSLGAAQGATGKALIPFLGDWSLGGHGGEVGSRGL